MQFDIITIFPKIFDSYFSESIVARARRKKIIKINVHDLREYADDKHKSVDDAPYGGGAGMVLKIGPIYKALVSLKVIKNGGDKKDKLSLNTGVFLMSAKGKKYSQEMAREFLKLKRIVLICGRYEGTDERVAKYLVDSEISVGEFILTGGEIPAMIIVDSVSRLIKGVLGNEKSIKNESFSKNGCLQYPHYTRPEVFLLGNKKELRVPSVLLSGNHENIKLWKIKHRKCNSETKSVLNKNHPAKQDKR